MIQLTRIDHSYSMHNTRIVFFLQMYLNLIKYSELVEKIYHHKVIFYFCTPDQK